MVSNRSFPLVSGNSRRKNATMMQLAEKIAAGSHLMEIGGFYGILF